MLLAALDNSVRVYHRDFLHVETARRPQRHLLDLALHAIEHENESRGLAVGDVELGTLISVNIQEKSGAAQMAVAAVIDDEGVLPNIGSLHQSIFLTLVGQIANARHLHILTAAPIHDDLGILRLRGAQSAGRRTG